MFGLRPLVALLVIVGLVIGGVAIYQRLSHPGRSVAAYCKVFYGDGEQFRSEFQDASHKPLEELIDVISAPAQLSALFGKLNAVAPPDIQPDVAQLQQAFQQESNGEAGDVLDPLGGLVSGLVNGVTSAPAVVAVDKWTTQHCGPPPA